MKELAEALKKPNGALRMRQGEVTAVSGSTCTLLVGGSAEPVEEVAHLNSVAPQVGDIVWVASDGADLWIIGTHGDPPPIDPARLPAFETYFTEADPAGAPAAPTGLSVSTQLTGLLVRWDLPPEALWRTWEVQTAETADFAAPTTVVADQTVVAVPGAAGSGPWYVRVRALNTRSEVSSWTVAAGNPYTLPAMPPSTVDWASMPPVDGTKITDLAISTPKLAANAVTAAKISVADVQAAVVTSAAVNAVAISADSITAGTLSVARIAAGAITAAKLNVADVQAAVVTAAVVNALTLNAVKITGGSIDGATITGGTIRTTPTASGKRVQIDTSHTISWYSGDASENTPGKISAFTYSGGGGYLSLSGPTVIGQAMSSYISLHGAASRKDILLSSMGGAGVTIGPADEPNEVRVVGNLHVTGTYDDADVDGNLVVGGSLGVTGAASAASLSCSGDVSSSGGRIIPGAIASGTSADGVWIQDLNTAGRFWKLYMYDPGTGRKLYMRYGSGGSEYRAI